MSALRGLRGLLVPLRSHSLSGATMGGTKVIGVPIVGVVLREPSGSGAKRERNL